MRALVVGAGFGGLAAAIRLAAAGHEVTLLDKRDRIGGRAYQYELNGFRFDGGPTVLTAPFMFEELFALAGERLEDHVTLVPVDPFYRAFDAKGRSFDFHADGDALAEEVARHSPSDSAGFATLERRVAEIFDAFYPYTERPMMRLTVMLRMLPFLVKHRAMLGVQHLVNSCVRDPFLRQALAFHPLLIGGHPSWTPSLYSLIVQFERRWGVHYALGGTGALVDALGSLLERLGGRIRCDADVERVLVTGGAASGVRLSGGEEIPADVVVSNADPGYTYGTLLADHPAAGAGRLQALMAKPSMSLHVLYWGADRTWPLTELAHHNLMLGGKTRHVLGRVFRFPRTRRRLARGSETLDAGDLFMYVHVPTRTDPSIAPEGCEGLYVLVAAPPAPPGADSEQEAESVREAVLDALDQERYLPGLREHLIAEHAVGPEHFRDVLNTPYGAAFSSQPTLFQSGWFRPHNQVRGVSGVYLVGAGTHPGAGVPAVLASGKIAAELIAHRASTTPPQKAHT